MAIPPESDSQPPDPPVAEAGSQAPDPAASRPGSQAPDPPVAEADSQAPDPSGQEPRGERFADHFAPGARRILTHARWLAAAFFGSWAAAYLGSRFDVNALYYVGLGGVGLTMVLVLIWLRP